ncbi:MAG: response regulator [Deltaproteobacteria bacterium]|nr:response regulator [Deltaproteobacteria bacterium]
MRKYEILVVDDDPAILETMEPVLQQQGYGVSTARNGAQALIELEKRPFDLVLTDLAMKPVDGIGVLQAVKAKNPEMVVIILTGYGDITSAIEALRLNADDYMLKPCEPDEIIIRVARCLEKVEDRRKLKIFEKILPVCCQCKSIRDDQGRTPGTGEWMSMERYIWQKAKLDISSTYCPNCAQAFERELACELEAESAHSTPEPVK